MRPWQPWALHFPCASCFLSQGVRGTARHRQASSGRVLTFRVVALFAVKTTITDSDTIPFRSIPGISPLFLAAPQTHLLLAAVSVFPSTDLARSPRREASRRTHKRTSRRPTREASKARDRNRVFWKACCIASRYLTRNRFLHTAYIRDVASPRIPKTIQCHVLVLPPLMKSLMTTASKP